VVGTGESSEHALRKLFCASTSQSKLLHFFLLPVSLSQCREVESASSSVGTFTETHQVHNETAKWSRADARTQKQTQGEPSEAVRAKCVTVQETMKTFLFVFAVYVAITSSRLCLLVSKCQRWKWHTATVCLLIYVWTYNKTTTVCL